MPDTSEENLQVAIYHGEDGTTDVVVHVKDENVWLTQTEMGEVFAVGRDNISKHITNIFQEGEVPEEGNVKKIHNGFSKPTNVYSLDVIISVGYRVNSLKATHFRQWATEQLKQLSTQGFAVDERVLKADPSKINELYQKLREIRSSEANMYKKVTDVFKESSLDYDASSSAAKHFFAIAQDKFHYAVTQKTAAEIVLERSDGEKEKVGMIAYRGEKPTLQDVKTAKNYLDAEEMRLLQNISEQFLLFAESKAFRSQKMTMEELATKLNVLLMANDYPVLYEYPAYKRGQADEHARAELKKYQNKLASGDVTKALEKPDSSPIEATEQALKRAVRVPKPTDSTEDGGEEPGS